MDEVPAVRPTADPETAQPPPVMLARFRVGVVGESRRTVHVVPIDDAHVTADGLIAYCGQEIPAGTAVRLNQLEGMPCNLCVLRAAPTPE